MPRASEDAPNEVKRILCLANSRKLTGRCIAGREIVNGQPGAWIRPVSEREHQEVSEHERHYEDGSDPGVLDVVAVPLDGPRPHEFQQENWIIDPKFYWQKHGQMNWTQVQAFLDPAAPLWINRQSSLEGSKRQGGPATSGGLAKLTAVYPRRLLDYPSVQARRSFRQPQTARAGSICASESASLALDYGSDL